MQDIDVPRFRPRHLHDPFPPVSGTFCNKSACIWPVVRKGRTHLDLLRIGCCSFFLAPRTCSEAKSCHFDAGTFGVVMPACNTASPVAWSDTQRVHLFCDGGVRAETACRIRILASEAAPFHALCFAHLHGAVPTCCQFVVLSNSIFRCVRCVFLRILSRARKAMAQ